MRLLVGLLCVLSAGYGIDREKTIFQISLTASLFVCVLFFLRFEFSILPKLNLLVVSAILLLINHLVAGLIQVQVYPGFGTC